MPKPMKLVVLERAFRAGGCEKLREGAGHTLWVCTCGDRHKVAVPRHREVSAGVVGDVIRRMSCQPSGWLR